MPGFELIDNKEIVGNILKMEGYYCTWFEKLKNFHVRNLKKSKCFFKCKHSLTVTSGTAAIEIALQSFKNKPGDEIITQAFNFIATIEAIIDVEQTIFINVDETLNMDVKDLKKITKNTK